jgi:hypothetical protein
MRDRVIESILIKPVMTQFAGLADAMCRRENFTRVLWCFVRPNTKETHQTVTITLCVLFLSSFLRSQEKQQNKTTQKNWCAVVGSAGISLMVKVFLAEIAVQ